MKLTKNVITDFLKQSITIQTLKELYKLDEIQSNYLTTELNNYIYGEYKSIEEAILSITDHLDINN